MQTREVIRRLVREHPLLESLSEPERRFVEDIGVLATVEAGHDFIREGEANPDLYLICTGSGELLKTPEEGDTPFAIGTFAAGDTLGELSFLDGMPRSASVRAAQPTEVVILPRTAFDQNSPVAARVWMKLEHNLAVLAATRLKSTSRDYVKSLQTEVELLQEQVHFGTLFVYMIIVFGLNWIMRDVIQNHFSQYYYFDSPDFNLWIQRAVAWVGFILLALPVAIMIRKIGFPIREVLDLRPNLRRCVTEALVIAAAIVVAVWLLTSGLVHVPGFTTAHATLSVGQVMAVISPDYLLHSYIQELAARGIMQNTMQRFLRDEHGVRSIMVLSLAFGVMHTHLGLTMVLSATVASVCFGFFYRRHRNLIGVTIVHYITGVAGRYLTMIASI